MKSLIRIRYILFALIILGFFANFAQNDYGWTIIAYSELFIAITFLLSLFTDYKNAENKKWFVTATVLGAYSFAAFYLEDTGHNHIFLNSASALSLLFFILFGIFFLLKNKNEHRFWIFLFTLFFLSTIFGVYALGFTVRLPLKVISMHITASIVLLLSVLLIFRKKIRPDIKENIFLNKFKQMPDFIVIVYVFFLWLCTYWELRDIRILPDVFSSYIPPALNKLKEEGKKEQAEKFWTNYEAFIENRKKENK